MSGKPWTDNDRETLRSLYSDTPSKEIARILGRTLPSVYGAADLAGLNKSVQFLASSASGRLAKGVSAGSIANRFKPGQVPFNKGLRRKGYAPGRMAETQFKKGQLAGRAAALWQPVGSERITKDGYLQRKITDTGDTPNDYVEVHRIIWEEVHGTVPPGHALCFKDGDKTHIAVDNLELITRKELMLRNSSQRWGKEVFEVIQLRGALNRKLRSLSEKQNDGSTQPSL